MRENAFELGHKILLDFVDILQAHRDADLPNDRAQRMLPVLGRGKEKMDQQMNKVIQDGMKTLNGVIELLPAQKRREFLPELQAIERRYADPYFYLSVIGNFNSGKSTFLNALLGMDLLSINDLPTTATPTYIRWNQSEILKQRRLSVRVKKAEPCICAYLTNGKRYFLDNFQDSQVQQFEKDTSVNLPEDIGLRIDFLTTTNALAERIQRIDISFPERPEFQHFCLIDTPGINPGEESNSVHILNTQTVLRETSDCAIILYPGMNTMTANMKKFIETNAEHLLGNAIVFLTKMDMIPAKEWDKIRIYTEKILREQFHQENPLVYPISAWMAQEYQSNRDTSENAKQYAAMFSKATSVVMQILQSRRMSIFSQRLMQLMAELAGSVEGAVGDLQMDLKNQAAMLRSHSWENMSKEVAEIQRRFRQNLENQRVSYQNKIDWCVRIRIDSACEDVCNTIDSASSRDELNYYSGGYYKEAMSQAQQKVIQEIEKAVFQDIEASHTRHYLRAVEKCLQQHERYLGAMSLTSEEGENCQGLSIDVNSEGRETSFWSANGVTVLSTILFGIPGLAVGRLIDWLRWDSIKNKAKEKVRSEADELKTKLSVSINIELENYKRGLYRWSENVLDQYQKDYCDLYNQAETAYQSQQEEVAKKTQEYDLALKQLGDLRMQIAAKSET